MTSFEILVIVASLGALLLLQRSDKNAWKKYIITAIGVLLFEYFTQALWLNKGLAAWSYLYLDVNWVLTLGWTAIILISVAFVDYALPGVSDKKRYVVYIVGASIVGLFSESLVTALGIREYTEASQSILSGVQILGTVPVEAIYYIPVFMALVIAFKKYWESNLTGAKSGGKR
jgi:hypothetical protein